jgi:holo-[acyl-carrier protein] synthase
VIIGIGIDLLDTKRFEQELARQSWSVDDGIFTAQEIIRCSAARNPAVWYSACFAAKEAGLKALGLATTDLGLFREVEVDFLDTRQELIFHKRPRARSRRLGVRNSRLALDADSVNAAAIVVLET